jgi:hypothetical protein
VYLIGILVQFAAMGQCFSYHLPSHSYSYQQLPLKQHIRLLVLYPARYTKSKLKGKLITQVLEDAPSYECLSYTWGNEKPNRNAKLNSSAFPIRPNLEAALRRLRRKDKARTLWIDAICINQLNTRERSSQVSIMRNIFARADRVLIWLGEEEKDGFTPRAFEKIPVLAKLSKKEMRDYVMENITSAEFRDDLDSLNRLGSRPWWNRVWVLQEFAVAKEVVLLCGAY